MSSTHVRSTAKKAPNQQRPIQQEIVIGHKSADKILTILAKNPAVEKLMIRVYFVTSPVISAIFGLKHLTNLNLWNTEIGDADAREIANHLVGSNLTSLNLGYNHIGDAGAAEIANHLKGSNLRSLSLVDNERRLRRCYRNAPTYC